MFRQDAVIPLTPYVIADVALSLDVFFEFADDCDLDMTLLATVTDDTGSVIDHSSFITFDDEECTVVVETSNSALVGYYDVSISSEFNLLDPNSITTSQDTIDFELVLSATACIDSEFGDYSIANMVYYIDEHQGSDYINPTFDAFTVITGTCGATKYTLDVLDPSMSGIVTLPTGTRDLTVATNDMSLIGTYEVEILVELEDHLDLTPVLGVIKTVFITIDNRCLNAVFSIPTAYWPLMTQ